MSDKILSFSSSQMLPRQLYYNNIKCVDQNFNPFKLKNHLGVSIDLAMQLLVIIPVDQYQLICKMWVINSSSWLKKGIPIPLLIFLSTSFYTKGTVQHFYIHGMHWDLLTHDCAIHFSIGSYISLMFGLQTSMKWNASLGLPYVVSSEIWGWIGWYGQLKTSSRLMLNWQKWMF